MTMTGPGDRLGGGAKGTVDLLLSATFPETATTRTFRLVAGRDPVPDFRPGQYVRVVARLPHLIAGRSYSVSSAPGSGVLDLTVRLSPSGLVTRRLFQHTAPGDSFEVAGPEGCLVAPPEASLLVLLAGGTGVAPFLSIVRDRAARGDGPRIVLLYNNHDRGDMAFADELARLAEVHSWLAYLPILTCPDPGWSGARGLVTAAHIREVAGDLAEACCLVSGPAEMVQHGVDRLKECGVSADRIRLEGSGSASEVTAEPGWPGDVPEGARFRVHVQGQGDLEVVAGEPLRDALAAAGIEGPAACRSGECGRCSVRVVEGTVFAPPATRILESGPGGVLLHACGAFAVSDLVVAV